MTPITDVTAIEKAFIDWHRELITTEELMVIVEFSVEDEVLRRACVDHIIEMEALAYYESQRLLVLEALGQES